MEGPQRLTIASTWSFSSDFALELRDKVSGTAKAGGGFVRYDRNNDAFVIENCNSLTAAAGLGSMLADTVEAEQANDLLEVPRITRLAAANVLEEPDEQPREEYDGLVDASAAGAQKVVSFVEKSWEPSLPYGVDCFAKAPFDIIGGISQLTNTTLYYDDNNTRIVVSGNRSGDVDAAMQKLSNLETPMYHFGRAPKTANLLNTPAGKNEQRVVVASLASLAEAAIGLKRVLVERDENLEKYLPGAYTTFAPTISPGEGIKVPKNLRQPPRISQGRSRPPSIWNDFKVTELGDPDNQPDKKMEIETERAPQNIAMPNVGLNGESHPYLTKEKASIVQRFVENTVDAFSGEEMDPNTAAPAEAKTELQKAPVTQAPGRRRVAAPARRAIAPAPTPAQESAEQLKASSSEHGKAASPSSNSLETRPERNESTSPVNVESHDVPSAPKQPETAVNTSGRRRRVAVPERAAASPAPAAAAESSTPPTTRDTAKVGSADPFDGLFRLEKQKIQESSAVKTASSPIGSPLSKQARSPQANVRSPQPSEKEANAPDATGKWATSAGSLLDIFDDPPETLQQSQAKSSFLAPLQPAKPHEAGKPANGSGCPALGPSSSSGNAPKSNGQPEKGLSANIKEPEPIVFHRTMGQKARNRGSQQKTPKISRKEAIEAAYGPMPQVVQKVVKSQPEALSKFKKDAMEASRAELTLKVSQFADCMIPVLDSFRSFPGALRLEIQLGCILIEDVPTNAVGSLIQPKTWNEHFRPNHALVTPRTLFTNVLTSSGADIDYILSLKGEKRNAEKSPLFLREPLGRLVWYEFHCKTKNNDTIIINIAENADAFVSRPQETLGSVNIHCPSNVWDAAAVVKGRFEYKRGVDLAVDRAIADFMEKLFIPEGENVCIYTRMPDGSVLHVEKAFMKRETKHKCSSSILGDVEGQSEANADTDDQGMVLLQITEVQSLVIGEFGHDRGYLRLRAKPYDSMVREQRLWYEVAVVSTVVEDALNINRELELGETTEVWSAAELMGLGNSSPAQRSDASTASTASFNVGNASIANMFRVANGLVERIDSVGQKNDGPGPYILEEQLLAAGQLNASMPHLASGSASMHMALQTLGGTRTGNTHNAETVRAMDSVSVQAGEENVNGGGFW